VPRMGMTGAAVASAITVATTNIWSLIAVRRELNLFPYDAGYLKLAAPALVCGGVLLALNHAATGGHADWRVAGLGLVCGYASFMGTLAIFGLDGEDRQIARLVWARITQNRRRNEVGV